RGDAPRRRVRGLTKVEAQRDDPFPDGRVHHVVARGQEPVEETGLELGVVLVRPVCVVAHAKVRVALLDVVRLVEPEFLRPAQGRARIVASSRSARSPSRRRSRCSSGEGGGTSSSGGAVRTMRSVSCVPASGDGGKEGHRSPEAPGEAGGTGEAAGTVEAGEG